MSDIPGKLRLESSTARWGCDVTEELLTGAVAGLDEADVVMRVTRYSNLRCVERALRPSVRQRHLLPTNNLGSDILQRLQKLLEQVRSPDFHSDGDIDAGTFDLEGIDRALERFSDQLRDMIESTPLMQLRSTLPSLASRFRAELVALLDFCLEECGAIQSQSPPFVVDFLITLLSRQSVNGVMALRRDPMSVSPGVLHLCKERGKNSDPRALALASMFRQARIELLELDNLDEIIERMREVKGELGLHLFHPDVLRAVVAYNIAAENRFRELIELEHAKDQVLERTLEALSRLDSAVAEPTDASTDSALASAGVRALEEALRERLTGLRPEADAAGWVAQNIDLGSLDQGQVEALLNPRNELWNTLTRAAVVVGLALRDLPALSERLHELDIDTRRMETDWVHELDQALQSAIDTLGNTGQSERAGQLARTRMKFLSGSPALYGKDPAS